MKGWQTAWIMIGVLGIGFASVAPAQTLSLDELLQQVKEGRAKDAKENQARLVEFQRNKSEQIAMLKKIQAEKTAEEQRAQQLEKQFEANDVRIVELEQILQERLGSLKELFGVLQQAAGDARGQFENSLTNVQYPDRIAFLTELAQKMGQTSRLASLEEIERLWYELQREMTESGKVTRFTTPVVTISGTQEDQSVTRVGLFNIVSNGKYLEYIPETGRLTELPRQPQNRYLSRITSLESTQQGLVGFGLDPSRGQLLSLLVQAPKLDERIAQGGPVGYTIIALGIIALLIAIERMLSLSITGGRFYWQMRNPQKAGNNPLGRVLKVYHSNPQSDVETLELKLSEAVLKEQPKLNRMLSFLKIIAVVAPLMGLLGTVVGMIITFQAITLFGTGDPKLMAGGISQALVTTVLGLCVAIPTVLLHTLVATRAKRLSQILEEQAAGMVAEQAEQTHRQAAPAS